VRNTFNTSSKKINMTTINAENQHSTQIHARDKQNKKQHGACLCLVIASTIAIVRWTLISFSFRMY
jgi:hypothetical protein